MRNVAELPAFVRVRGVAPGVRLAVRVTAVVVGEGSKTMFVWSLGRPRLTCFAGLGLVPGSCVVTAIGRLHTI